MEWKTVEQYPIFEVSDCGTIARKERIGEGIRCGKRYTKKIPRAILSPWIAKTGYLVISCAENGKRNKYLVHRLVAMAFVGGYEPDLTVNHINGIKTDNRPHNLEWVTLAENTRLQWATNLVNIRGEKHPSSKILDKDVLDIRAKIKAGASIKDIAKIYNVSTDLIYKIRKGTKKAFIK